jgi:hypothetical protein
MSTKRTAAVLVSMLAMTAGTHGAEAAPGDAAQAEHGFQVSPRVGRIRTTFRVTFTAPFRANGRDTDYLLEAVGPPNCASVFEFTGPVSRGEKVVMRLTPADDIVLPGFRRRWCRGTYVGYVYYQTPGTQPNRFIGYFSFGVGRRPVSLAG